MISGRWKMFGLTSVGLFVLLFATACPPPPGARVRVVGPRPPRVAVRATVPAPRGPAIVTAPALAQTGAAANGAISYPNQRIRYPISISYPRVVNIYVQGHGLDPTVAIYDAFGNRLAYNDDGGSGLDSALSYTLAPGSYLIEVAGFGSSTGAYTLTVN